MGEICPERLFFSHKVISTIVSSTNSIVCMQFINKSENLPFFWKYHKGYYFSLNLTLLIKCKGRNATETWFWQVRFRPTELNEIGIFAYLLQVREADFCSGQ